MNTDKLLGMLLKAIDYSFLQMDGSYDKTLTYPVIDKIQYIKKQVKNMEVKEVDLEKEMDKYFDPCENCEDDKLAGTCASISELGRCPLKYRKEEGFVSEDLDLGCGVIWRDKESVSEDLEMACENYVKSTLVGSPFIKKNAFKVGWRAKEQQMMANAITAHCFGFQGDALFSFRLPAKDYLIGSEVKVIVIKQE